MRLKNIFAAVVASTLVAAPVAAQAANPAQSLSVAGARAGTPAGGSQQLRGGNGGGVIVLILAAVIIAGGIYLAVDDDSNGGSDSN